MEGFNVYKVCIEDRDEDGNVTNSDMVFESKDREEAIRYAQTMRNKYGTVVIETWFRTPNEDNITEFDEDFCDTTLESEY